MVRYVVRQRHLVTIPHCKHANYTHCTISGLSDKVNFHHKGRHLLDGPKMTKMKMAAFFSRKVIISILLRKSCLGSKLGDLRSGNLFM